MMIYFYLNAIQTTQKKWKIKAKKSKIRDFTLKKGVLNIIENRAKML